MNISPLKSGSPVQAPEEKEKGVDTPRSPLVRFLSFLGRTARSLVHRTIRWIRSAPSKATAIFQKIFYKAPVKQNPKINPEIIDPILASYFKEACPFREKKHTLDSWLAATRIDWGKDFESFRAAEDPTQFHAEWFDKDFPRSHIAFNQEKPKHSTKEDLNRFVRELEKMGVAKDFHLIRYQVESFIHQGCGGETLRKEHSGGYLKKNVRDDSSLWISVQPNSYYRYCFHPDSHKIVIELTSFDKIVNVEHPNHAVLGYDAYRAIFEIDLSKAKEPLWLRSPGCVAITCQAHGYRTKETEISWS